MRLSPIVEFWEVLYPSLLTIPGHPGHWIPEPTRDHHRVRDGVRDGAGIPVINRDETNLVILPVLHVALTKCSI